MKICFLFPGKGAQNVGMGKDLYEKYEEIREVYEKASNITGIDIADLSFNQNEEILSQTKNTQISILTMCLGILKILENNNINPEMAAGLSLGEYSALEAAKAISFEDSIKIVQKRGEYMQDLVPKGDWAMAAVIGLEDEKVNEVCKKITKGFAVPANYNCPGQVAVSGDKEGIEELIDKAKTAGAKRVIELKTGGPFHTEKLKAASVALRKELEKIEIQSPKFKVFKNIDAKPYTETDDMIDILSKHVINPVRFSETIENMLASGIDTFVEIGPGKVLTGFVKKINKDVNCININSSESLEEALDYLKNS